jgi:hypothetical protein
MKPGFIREIYLRSTPSVDLDLLPEGERINPSDHTLPMRVYDRILNEHIEGDEDRLAATFFMLDKGPQLIELIDD